MTDLQAGRPGADHARDRQAASGWAIRPLQELRASAAGRPCPGAQPRGAAVAGTDGAL